MARSRCKLRKSSGLTLIEVLVALAIVAIAIMAVIKASSQTTRNTVYLQKKIMAIWVATEVMNELRLDLRLRESKSTTVFGQRFYWQVSKETTANAKITKVKVLVFEDQGCTRRLAGVESYVS